MLVGAGFGPFPEPISMMEHGMATMYGGALLDNQQQWTVPGLGYGITPGAVAVIARPACWCTR
jgi:hypothetical protein